MPTPPSRWLTLPLVRQISQAAAVRQLRHDLTRWYAEGDQLLRSEPDRDDVLDLLAAATGGDAQIDRFVDVGNQARVTAYQPTLSPASR